MNCMGEFMRSLIGSLRSTLSPDGRLVAIDGVDGSGKTSFAAALVAEIHDRPTIVVHADHFLNPSPVRYAKGRHSPEGFWTDTYDYEALCAQVLGPLGPAGDGWYSPASYDAKADRTVPAGLVQAPADALVIVEGMFLHRDELAPFWDASVFLDVPFTETAARMAVRDGSSHNPDHPSMHRYVGGQRLYFEAVRPWERATVIVDNTDYTAQRIISSAAISALR